MPRKPRLTAAQQLSRAARAGEQVQMAELPAKVMCPRCGVAQWPDDAGEPRFHLRAARPGDADYSDLVPVMVDCD